MKPIEVVAVLEQVGRLKSIPRTGWVRAGISHAESVADHSYRTIVLAPLLGDELGVDTNRLMRLLAIHDLAESEVGDLTPEDASRDEKHRRENEAMERLCRILPNGREVSELWNEYSEERPESRTPEAAIAKELDALEMALQAREYGKQHPQIDLSRFRRSARERIHHPLLIGIFDAACGPTLT